MTDLTLSAVHAKRREIAHTVSPGLWTLAWRRLRRDRVAMVSLAIVTAFLLLMVASALNLVASDWAREVGVNYAPPSFVESEAAPAVTSTPDQQNVGAGSAVPSVVAPDSASSSTVVDPLADVMKEIEAAKNPPPAAEGKSVDPLADVMKEIQSGKGGGPAAAVEAKRATLPFGADKWGRDVIAKTIKGSETSIFVGLAAALVATLIGTVLGALAGYHGGWVDDALNWFYNVFSSIPYLLLILAVAAVLQQKGTLTIVLILGLTGWTGAFRLIRAEYLKHKGREYVQAADAIGASNTRRMVRHIFPNVSHVVLVQMSILVVAFIKSEVILSFLGFGVPVDVVSWGSMLNEAQNELILGKWWQLAAAGGTMAVLVTAFSLFTDALRDALDPKLRGTGN
ncbi:MAG: ABC transporter permease subunit [Casimicrobiaceae bacterium]